MAVALIFCLVVVVPIITSIIIGISRLFSKDKEIIPYDEMPAGVIHVFKTNSYMESSPDNPCRFPTIDWNKGHWSVVPHTVIEGMPDIQRALVGTIRFLKPNPENGQVMVVLSNETLGRMGYAPMGLVPECGFFTGTTENLTI